MCDLHSVPSKQLKVGQIVAENVVSKKGQIIVNKFTCLSRQMISQILNYRIEQVNIIDGEIPAQTLESIERKQQVEKTYLKKIFEKPDFKEFKKRYASALNLMENNLNQIIFRNVPIDQPALITDSIALFEQYDTSYELFSVIHEMQNIDSSTQAHSLNVSIISRLIGTWIGMSREDLDLLTLAGVLHDIGKSRIPDVILLKPGKLTPQEYEFIKKHTIFGYEAIKDQKLDKRIKDAVLLHHERYDGSGYPFGYSGDKLCTFACIVSIADVYDAMTSRRCYHDSICPFDVISIFESEGLEKYHPDLIITFLKKIASSFLGSNVLLSNEEAAQIVFLTDKLTRPIIKLAKSNEIIKLEERPDLYIQAII